MINFGSLSVQCQVYIPYESFNLFSSLFFLINRIFFSLGSALEVLIRELELPVP